MIGILWFKIQNILSCIQNTVRWLPIIWKDRDYDWVYILIMLQFKLKNLKKRYEHHELYVGQESDVEWLNVCIKLIQVLIDGKIYKGYVNVNNLPYYKKLKHNGHIPSCYISEAYEEKCRYLLFKILAWRMPFWWD